MRCTGCQAENPDNAAACSACGAVLPRKKPRRRAPEGLDAPLSPESEAFFRQARGVYWWALLSLAPPLGPLIGPVAFFRSWRLRQRAGAPDWLGMATLKLSMWIGAGAALTQAAGLALLVASFWPGG